MIEYDKDLIMRTVFEISEHCKYDRPFIFAGTKVISDIENRRDHRSEERRVGKECA